MTKKIKVWGRDTSSNVKKVLWLADELGLAVDRIEAGGKHGVVNTDAYKAMNPNMRVPTLEDGDFVLWESNSIMRYLCLKYGGEHLYPLPPKIRADIDRWLDWSLSSVVPLDSPLLWATIRTPPEKHDKAMIAKTSEKLGEVYRILDDRLKTREYLAGEKFSIADLALSIFVHRYLLNPYFKPAKLPAVEAWHRRLHAQPGFQKHVNVPLE